MASLEVMETMLEVYGDKIKEYDKIINGNGQEGLRSKVSKMSVYLKVLLAINSGVLSALIYLILGA